MPRGFILAFHSHNIAGNTYETNDHVALDESLGLLAALGIPVLRLADIVRALRDGHFERLPRRFAAADREGRKRLIRFFLLASHEASREHPKL